jgi:hypothetical protein
VGEGWDVRCRRTIEDKKQRMAFLHAMRGSADVLVRTFKCSCGGTPRPASPKLALLAKAPHPSATRG